MSRCHNNIANNIILFLGRGGNINAGEPDHELTTAIGTHQCPTATAGACLQLAKHLAFTVAWHSAITRSQ